MQGERAIPKGWVPYAGFTADEVTAHIYANGSAEFPEGYRMPWAGGEVPEGWEIDHHECGPNNEAIPVIRKVTTA